jgi:hypothetical protein
MPSTRPDIGALLLWSFSILSTIYGKDIRITR